LYKCIGIVSHPFCTFSCCKVEVDAFRLPFQHFLAHLKELVDCATVLNLPSSRGLSNQTDLLDDPVLPLFRCIISVPDMAHYYWSHYFLNFAHQFLSPFSVCVASKFLPYPLITITLLLDGFWSSIDGICLYR
uniref:Secreted protein n=1 Tax=Haemonchus placei TaxID=6290 RepID=A0A0N4WB15_HAEPC